MELTPTEFGGSAALIWFIVWSVRSWFPARLTSVFDADPRRVWVLVIASAAVIVLLSGAGASMETALEVLTLSLASVGVEEVQSRTAGVRRQS